MLNRRRVCGVAGPGDFPIKHLTLELCSLRRAAERKRRARARADRLRHGVEVARADLALVACRRVAELLERELAVLELDVRGHSARGVAARELERGRARGVEPGQRDELEAVAERGQLLLEARDLVLTEVRAPVERGRAVVC